MQRPRTEEQICGRGCTQRVCTEGVHRGEAVCLLVCFAVIKFHSVFVIHNFLQTFCRLPLYSVREVSVCGYLCGDAGSHGDQKQQLTWKLELQAVVSLLA